MKKRSSVLVLFVLFIIMLVSCNKEENEAPEFSKIEFSIADSTAILTFSEAVYAKNDGTGNLGAENFKLSITAPEPVTISYYIVHLGGNTTAKFQFNITSPISGDEVFTINPASASSIYDAEGMAMEANQEVSFILE